MATNYPGSLDNSTSLPYPSATNDTNNPSLAGGQDNQNDAVIAVETKVGINSSTATATTALLGVGSGQSQWGNITPAYMSAVTGTGAFVCATAPTISSATLNTPTINNPTLKTDSVVGYTTSQSGTVYGMSVTSGILASAAIANQVNTAAIQNGAVTGTKLSSSTITLGVVNITSNQTTTNTSATQVSGLSATVTVPAGGRYVKVLVTGQGVYNDTSQDGVTITLWDGTVGSGTQIAAANYFQPNFTSASEYPLFCMAVVLPAAGSKTYNVGFQAVSGGTAHLVAGGSSPTFLLVECI